MNLAQHRQAVLDAISEVVTSSKAFDHLPARISPPCAIVLPAEPYVSAASDPTPGTFCEPYEVRHALSLVAPTGDSSRISAQLDDMLDRAVVALVEAGIGVDSVSGFYEFDQSGASTFIACEITTIQPSTLTEEN